MPYPRENANKMKNLVKFEDIALVLNLGHHYQRREWEYVVLIPCFAEYDPCERLLLRSYSKDWIHQRHGTKLVKPSNWLRSFCYCSLPIVESDWKGTLAVHPLSYRQPINYSLVHFNFWFLVWFSIEFIWAFLSNPSHRFLQ